MTGSMGPTGSLVNDAGSGSDGAPASDGGIPEGSTLIETDTIYANTDTALYSLDPATNAVNLLGTFAGTSDASTDSTITDVAVNASGTVYVCSESVIYTAPLPATGGVITLQKQTSVTLSTGAKIYALAFTPVDALGAGTGEVLIAGDGNGEVWAIDATGAKAPAELGNFGSDPTESSHFLALSGDMVFYNDASGTSHGLATIRSCTTPAKPTDSPTCNKTNDFLAGIDMTAMAAAYTSGTPATSLDNGIYGGSMTTTGPGIGRGEVFGLGAWQGNVYGFSRAQSASGDAGAAAPALLTISTGEDGGAAGTGTVVSTSFGFTSGGWSGAGVTSKVTIIVPPPPPPPPPPPTPK
jgi:hypothetical protein